MDSITPLASLSHSNLATTTPTPLSEPVFVGHGLANTPAFSFSGQKLRARVIDVYDGDTLSVVMPVNSTFYKFHVRLNGIDTSELKSKGALKDKAVRARLLVLQLLGVPQQFNERKASQQYFDANIIVVTLECFDFEKYGRILANVYPMGSDEHLSAALLRLGLAVSYTGGSKSGEDFLTKH
jgi:endonuclease YncB( thermonuclease family)